MTKTNCIKFILIITLLPLGLVALECNENCASCGYKDNKVFCYVCQNGKKWENGECSTPLDSTDCLLHSAAGCLTCKQGTVMEKSQECAIATDPIEFCLIGTKGNCQVCSLSYPTEDGKDCSRQLVEGDHCVNGTKGPFGEAWCMQCEKGWVSVQGVCRSDIRRGCMFMNQRGVCVQCLDQWYMRYPGVCDRVKGTLNE